MTPEHKKWLWWAGAGIAALVVLWLIMRSTGGASSPSLNVANVGGEGSVGSLGSLGSLGVSGVKFLPNGGGLAVSSSPPDAANSGAGVTTGNGDTGTGVAGAGSTGDATTVTPAPPAHRVIVSDPIGPTAPPPKQPGMPPTQAK